MTAGKIFIFNHSSGLRDCKMYLWNSPKNRTLYSEFEWIKKEARPWQQMAIWLCNCTCTKSINGRFQWSATEVKIARGRFYTNEPFLHRHTSFSSNQFAYLLHIASPCTGKFTYCIYQQTTVIRMPYNTLVTTFAHHHSNGVASTLHTKSRPQLPTADKFGSREWKQ